MPQPTFAVPAPVRSAQVLLALVALTHLAVPLVMWADQGPLREQIAAQHPDLGAAEVIRSAELAVNFAVAFHAVLLALCAVLAWKLGTARPWTRRLTTVSQLLSILFSAFSWASSPMFHAVIPVIGAVQLIIVALLWFPAPAREFFDAAPSEDPVRQHR